MVVLPRIARCLLTFYLLFTCFEYSASCNSGTLVLNTRDFVDGISGLHSRRENINEIPKAVCVWNVSFGDLFISLPVVFDSQRKILSGQPILMTWYSMHSSVQYDVVCGVGEKYISKSTKCYEQNVSLQYTCWQTEICICFQSGIISNVVVNVVECILFWDRNSSIRFEHTKEKRLKCYVKYYANSVAIRRLLLSGDVELNPGPVTLNLNTNLNESPTSQIINTNNNIPCLASDLPSGLKFVSWNIQSLNAHLDQVRLILNSSNEANVIGFSETWLINKNFMDKDIQVDGYKLAARLDRAGDTWGGVAMLVKQNLPFDERKDLQHDNLEAIWIEVTYPNSSPILVATIYRPPKSTVLWYEHFIEMCEIAYSEGKEMVIMGDFNIDFLKPNSIPKQWIDIME